jgi:hypothetical protein
VQRAKAAGHDEQLRAPQQLLQSCSDFHFHKESSYHNRGTTEKPMLIKCAGIEKLLNGPIVERTRRRAGVHRHRFSFKKIALRDSWSSP